MSTLGSLVAKLGELEQERLAKFDEKVDEHFSWLSDAIVQTRSNFQKYARGTIAAHPPTARGL